MVKISKPKLNHRKR